MIPAKFPQFRPILINDCLTIKLLYLLLRIRCAQKFLNILTLFSVILFTKAKFLRRNEVSKSLFRLREMLYLARLRAKNLAEKLFDCTEESKSKSQQHLCFCHFERQQTQISRLISPWLNY